MHPVHAARGRRHRAGSAAAGDGAALVGQRGRRGGVPAGERVRGVALLWRAGPAAARARPAGCVSLLILLYAADESLVPALLPLLPLPLLAASNASTRDPSGRRRHQLAPGPAVLWWRLKVGVCSSRVYIFALILYELSVNAGEEAALAVLARAGRARLLPRLDTPASYALHATLDSIRQQRSAYLRLRIVKVCGMLSLSTSNRRCAHHRGAACRKCRLHIVKVRFPNSLECCRVSRQGTSCRTTAVCGTALCISPSSTAHALCRLLPIKELCLARVNTQRSCGFITAQRHPAHALRRRGTPWRRRSWPTWWRTKRRAPPPT